MSFDSGDIPYAMKADQQSLLDLLRRPERPWLEQARACRQLLQQGLSAEAIRRETGLEVDQQKIFINALEVYESLEQGKAPKPVLAHFNQSNDGVLHEFHPLDQTHRIHAATLAVAKHLDAKEAHSVAVAIMAFSRSTHPPRGFSDHSGDAVACQCWLSARREQDVTQREQLIARGLRFAHSAAARAQLTALLEHSPSTTTPNPPTP